MQVRHGAVKNAFITAVGNNSISLLAGIIIFGTVFSVLQNEMGMQDAEILAIMKSSGPASTGLTFIWLPQLFQRMYLGAPLAFIFFLGLTFAAFTSLIAMLELAARVLLDKGLKRSSAILIVAVVVYLAGIPSVISTDFLSNQDFVWGLGLLISGAFIAIALRKNNVRMISAEINAVDGDWKTGRWWMLNVSYFVPAASFLLILWWMFLSATVFAPGDWFNPFNPFSVMTCLLQWGTFLTILILCNKFIIKGL
jgi:NSS family neurotransmitter:Na+ symporter